MKALSDLTAPQKAAKRLLEADVQKQCVDWARARGYWARKFSSMTQRSVPDYLFARFAPDGSGLRLKFWTEFKKPGNTSTGAQLDEQAAMTATGWVGFECDNFDKFKFEVERIENTSLGDA